MTEDGSQPVIEARPCRDVSRAEFRHAAHLAGWEQRTITLFLDKRTPCRAFVPCGGELLRIKTW